MKKKDREMYEQVMGRKLSEKELSNIHKEAHTPFTELDNQEFTNRIKWILITLVIGLLGILIVRKR